MNLNEPYARRRRREHRPSTESAEVHPVGESLDPQDVLDAEFVEDGHLPVLARDFESAEDPFERPVVVRVPVIDETEDIVGIARETVTLDDVEDAVAEDLAVEQPDAEVDAEH